MGITTFTTTLDLYSWQDWNFIVILTILTPLHLFVILWHVIGPDRAEEAYVVIWMELCHLISSRFVWPLYKNNWLENLKMTPWPMVVPIFILPSSKYFSFYYLHIFPFSCINHNLTANYVSCVYGEVSLGALVHSNNFRCHLIK